MRKGSIITIYIILMAFSILTLLPFYIMFVGSFKTQREIINEPFTIPGKVHLSENIRWGYVRDETPVNEKIFAKIFGLKTPISPNKKIKDLAKNEEQKEAMLRYIASKIRIGNFVMAIKRGNLLINLANSFLITFASVFILSLFGAMAGYPLAKIKYSSFSLILGYLFLGLTLPRMLALAPLYETMMKLNLLNHPLSLILIYGASRMPMSIIIFSTFYKSIPSDLEDAAEIDGLSRIGFFFKVLLKMSHIPILTCFVINGTFVFNDFLTPLIFMPNMEFTTIQVALSHFIGTQTWFFGPIFAGCTVAIVPMLLVYLLLNKYFITGVTAGAVKG